MGLGILDDHKLEHVPGTAIFVEGDATQNVEPHINPRLKYDHSGDYPIILIPQPSDDPNDPLNWPLWKRDVQLFILSLLAVIASTLSSLLAANTLTISLYFGHTFTDVALLTGYHLMGVGVAGFLFVPSARVWGKRHAYLIGIVFIIFSSAWAGSTHNCGKIPLGGHCPEKYYVSLLWARIFQGVGLAPFEALVNASVGDMYFVHQRGKRMALTNLALFGGAFFTPVVVGKMTHTIGWQWSFYFVSIFFALLLPLAIFYLPETAYRRDAALNTDIATTNLHGSDDEEHRLTANKEHGVLESNVSGAKIPEKTPYWQTVKPFNGRKSDEGFFNLLFRPLPLFLHPGILWACLIQGTLIGWTVMIGIVLAAIMLGPPLFFDEVQTGYMYTGPFVGAILGFFLSGILADWSAKVLTRRNGGIYEPEFRLVLVIPQLIFGCMGLYGFGIVSSNSFKYGAIPPDVFFGFEVMGMVVGAVASALYIVDAHRDMAIEAFTCLLVFKNMFSFGLTWHSYDYLVRHGIRPVFVAVASVQVAVCMLTVPMYIFGKKNRSFCARHNVFFGISDAMAKPFNAAVNAILKMFKKGDSGETKNTTERAELHQNAEKETAVPATTAATAPESTTELA